MYRVFAIFYIILVMAKKLKTCVNVLKVYLSTYRLSFSQLPNKTLSITQSLYYYLLFLFLPFRLVSLSKHLTLVFYYAAAIRLYVRLVAEPLKWATSRQTANCHHRTTLHKFDFTMPWVVSFVFYIILFKNHV